METDRGSLGKESERPRENGHPPLCLETANLDPSCWFMVSRRALAPVAAGGEATKPGLAWIIHRLFSHPLLRKSLG